MSDTELFTNNRWLKIDFKELKKGDKFRVYNPLGNLAINKGKSEFIALCDAFVDPKNNQWTINFEDCKKVVPENLDI